MSMSHYNFNIGRVRLAFITLITLFLFNNFVKSANIIGQTSDDLHLAPGQLPSQVVLVTVEPSSEKQISRVWGKGLSDLNSGLISGTPPIVNNTKLFIPASTVTAPISWTANTADAPWKSMKLVTDWQNSANNLPRIDLITANLLNDQLLSLSYAAAHYRIPIILSASSSADMTVNPTNYPYVISAGVPDTAQADAFLHLCQLNNWRKVALFATEESQSQAFVQYIYSQLDKYPAMQIGVFYLPVASNAVLGLRAFQMATNMGFYIRLIVSFTTTPGYNILNQAWLYGWIAPPYQWLGVSTICQAAVSNLGARQYPGLTCFQSSVPRSSPTWTNYIYSLANLSPTNFRFGGGAGASSINSPPLASWASAYELMGIVSNGVNQLASSGQTYNGSNLLAAMAASNTTGPITGMVRTFDANKQVVNGMIDIVNFHVDPTNSKSFWTVGTFYQSTQSISFNNPLIYNDGTTKAPLDHIPIMEDGASLPIRGTTIGYVLGGLVSTLGIWTAGFSIRRAIEAKRRSRTFRLFAPHLVWLGCGALCFSLTGIFCFRYLIISLLPVPVFTVYVSTQSLALAAVVPSLLVYLGLFIAHTEIEYNSMTIIEQAKEVSNITRSAKHSGSLRGHQRGLTKGSVSCSKYLWKLYEYMQSVTWQQWTASIGFSAAFTTSFHISTQGIVLPSVCSHKSVGLFIILPVLMLPASLVMVKLFFSVDGLLSRSQLLVMVLLCLIIEQLIEERLYNFAFSQAQVESDWAGSAVHSGTVLLIVCCMAGVTAFVFLGLLLQRNRLSRNVLEVLLVKAQKQLQARQEDLKQITASQQLLQTDVAHFRQILEIMLTCRPIYQPHLLAMALAPPEQSEVVDSRADTGALANGSVFVRSVAELLRLTKDETAVEAILRTLPQAPSLFTPTEVSTSAVAPYKIPYSLIDLLSNPIGLELWKDYLITGNKRQDGLEATVCWLDIQRYKQLEDPGTRKKVATSMCSLYCTVNASLCLHPSILTYQDEELVKSMWISINSVSPSKMLFHSLEQSILRRLETEFLPGFGSTQLGWLASVIIT